MNAPLSKEQLERLTANTVGYRGQYVEGLQAPAVPARKIGAFARIAEFWRRRAVLDELSMLNDRELADIGLNRSELGNVFDQKFARARRDGVVA